MGELHESGMQPQELLELVHGDSPNLERISGEGRLLVSQPGGSDRITLEFHADQDRALFSFRNRIGVDGGELLVDRDSIRIWNKMENLLEIVSRNDPGLTPIGTLSTLPLPELFQVRLEARDIEEILEDDTYLNVGLRNGTRIIVAKRNGAVLELDHESNPDAHFERAVFDLHRESGPFRLPWKITIFGTDGETRLTLLIRDLSANSELPPLQLDLPSDIRTERL
ncbi:MAG: hypothetical protein WEA36_03275 [Balneolaceae bacterium]